MLRNLTLAFLTALFVSLSLAPLKLGFVSYWALVPYLFLIRDKSLPEVFSWSFITGLLVSFSTIHLTAFIRFEAFTDALTLNGFYFACLGLVLSWACRKVGRRALFLLPLLWVALDFVKDVSGLGMSATNIAYTHLHYLAVFNGIFNSGMYGIAFWLVLINVTIFCIFEELGNRRRVAAFAALAVLLLAVPWYFSRFIWLEPHKLEDDTQLALIRI